MKKSKMPAKPAKKSAPPMKSMAKGDEKKPMMGGKKPNPLFGKKI
ncbi:MAG: hypothetical protein V4621_07990 [Pseudomonadota bacterium]